MRHSKSERDNFQSEFICCNYVVVADMQEKIFSLTVIFFLNHINVKHYLRVGTVILSLRVREYRAIEETSLCSVVLKVSNHLYF